MFVRSQLEFVGTTRADITTNKVVGRIPLEYFRIYGNILDSNDMYEKWNSYHTEDIPFKKELENESIHSLFLKLCRFNIYTSIFVIFHDLSNNMDLMIYMEEYQISISYESISLSIHDIQIILNTLNDS